jgi:heme/copper-type cytochrome/quinol oxidase subunit 3
MLSVVITNEKSYVDRELSRHRPLRAQNDTTSNNTRVSDEARRVRCLQVIFIIYIIYEYIIFCILLLIYLVSHNYIEKLTLFST